MNLLALLANAQTDAACLGVGIAGGSGCSSSAIGGSFHAIANLLIFLVGAIAVLMLIIGALRYVLSGGDSANIKGAKDTIMYALIGVAVAIFAYALVTFVTGRLS